MKCSYKIKFNGEIVQFSSTQELDSFLASKYNDLVNGNLFANDADVTLMIDRQKTTVSKLEEIAKAFKGVAIEQQVDTEDGSYEVVYKIPKSKGMTSFISEAMTYVDTDGMTKEIPALATPFDVEAWKADQRSRKLKEGMSSNEIEKWLDNQISRWGQLTDYGTEIHQLFESVINPENVKYKNKLLSPELVETLKSNFTDFIGELKKKYGENSIFLTEVPIISKNISDDLKRTGIESINGRIDLLMIDENGNAHIFDYKVSPKSVGVWSETQNKKIKHDEWSSSKKLGIEYQQAGYKAILEQYGINVVTESIIPIKLNLELDENEQIVGLSKDGVKESGAIFDTSEILGENLEDKPKKWINQKHLETMQHFIPTATLMDDVDLVKSIQEPMTKFVPNYAVETQVQRKTVAVDQLRNNPMKVHTMAETEPDRAKGKFWFYNEYRRGKQWCNTEEELQNKLIQYVNDENEHRANELRNLASLINGAIEGYNTIDDFGNDESQFKGPYLRRIFSKYAKPESEGGWKFMNNPKLIAAGLFCFTKNGLCEIVSISHNLTHQVTNLGKGKTLLGATKYDYEVDEHKIMSATNGNIDLIKVMSLLNASSKLIENVKINKIASYNIWMQTGCETYPETLLNNFQRLCQEHNVVCNLTANNFCSTLQSTVNTIHDLCGEDLLTHIGGDWQITFSNDDISFATSWLLDRMQDLLKYAGEEDKRTLSESLTAGHLNFDDPIQLSFMLLGRALNKLNDYEVYIEKDVDKWIHASLKDGIWGGGYLNSMGNSPSLNLQTLGQIFSVAETHIRRKELSYEPKLRKVLKSFYEYNHRSSLIGGEVKYFKQLFKLDENGNIAKSFELKNPDDTSLSKEQSDFIRMFLEIVNDFKFKGNEKLIERAKADGTYYQVPIAMGSRYTQLYQKGFKQMIKSEWDEALNFLRLLPGQEENFMEKRKRMEVYNKFDMDSNTRADIIAKFGVEGLEIQLEDLLREVIHSYTQESVMKEYLPRMQALKLTLQYYNYMFGLETEGTNEIMDKFITVNAYGQPIMDKSMRSTYKFLSTVRNITGATILGFNFKSGIRELMQGI